MAGDFAYEYRILCCCGTEFETDDSAAFAKFSKAHANCKQPENEALTLLARLVTAAETIVEHSKGLKK